MKTLRSPSAKKAGYASLLLFLGFYTVSYLVSEQGLSGSTTANSLLDGNSFVEIIEQNTTIRPNATNVVNLSLIHKLCNTKKLLSESILVETCLQFLNTNYYLNNTNPSTSPNTTEHSDSPLNFHVYWKGEMNQMLSMVVKSFLFTQPLSRSKMFVWLHNSTAIDEAYLNSQLYSMPIVSFVPKYVEIKRWDTIEQTTYPGSPWNHEATKNLELSSSVSAFSDVVRFILLERYGGIFIDPDVLLLRDFTPLIATKKQFAFNWSYLDQQMTTAVLHMHSGSKVMDTIINNKPFTAARFHSFELSKISLKMPEEDRIENLPPPLFDPMWLKNDQFQPNSVLSPPITRFVDVFADYLTSSEQIIYLDSGEAKKEYASNPLETTKKLRKVEKFFPGAYAYRWHAKDDDWDRSFNRTSWLGTLEAAYNNFALGSAPNIYGEEIEFVY